MRAAVLFALAALIACNDAGLTQANGPVAVPTSSSSSGGAPDAGNGNGDGGGTAPPIPAEWGDPKSTRRPGYLRVAQLNTRRFFDTTCDSGDCSANGLEAQATQDAFDKRVDQLATSIKTLDADILTLEEIETKICLDALQAKLKEGGADYPVAHLAETGFAGGIDVAVLSRGELDSVKNYKRDTPLKRPDGSNTSFTRELPEVHLTLGDSKVIVFAAHFRSKSDDDAGRRFAEAKAAHDIMKATGDANSGALVVLGGDLNDTPGSEPLEALEGDGALLRVASDLPAAEQGTYRYQGADQPIDHIFVTKKYAGAYVAKSAKVERDPGRTGFGGSDHACLWADFALP